MHQANRATSGPRSRRDQIRSASTARLTADERLAVRPEQQSESAMDDALADSFPASDPPAWNAGLVRPGLGDTWRGRAGGDGPETPIDEPPTGTPGVIDVSSTYGFDRTMLQGHVSLAGAAGIALLVPVVILLVGLPVAFAIRALLEVLVWFFPGIA